MQKELGKVDEKTIRTFRRWGIYVRTPVCGAVAANMRPALLEKKEALTSKGRSWREKTQALRPFNSASNCFVETRSAAIYDTTSWVLLPLS